METGRWGKRFHKAEASSYPTYEEWKQALVRFVFAAPCSCSYPTYEEWKPLIFCYCNNSTIKFLSYLWGMETFYVQIFYGV